MSRNIHITVTGAAGYEPGMSPAQAASGSWSYDPGNDPSIAQVDDPGHDDSIAQVDDPGHDASIAQVDDPNGLAHAIALAQAYGLGGIPPGSVVVHPQNGGGCGCHGDEPSKSASVAPGLESETSGFVIVRTLDMYGSQGFETLDALAQHHGLAGLLTSLTLEAPKPGETGASFTQEIGALDSPGRKFLPSWPLILHCHGAPVRPDSADRDPASPGPGVPAGEESEKPSCRSRLQDLEAAAAASPYRPLHSLADYWRVDARSLGADKHAFAEALNALPEVGLAYCELAATDPGAGSGDFSEDQGYLDEAPVGIGATCVSPYLEEGQDTLGVHLIDLEQGWTLHHQNLGLGPSTVLPFGGESRPGHEHHGTAVVGELIAKADPGSSSPQVEGILPRAAFSVASHYFGENVPQGAATHGTHLLHHTNGHVANAIVATLLGLSKDGEEVEGLRGKILLLEVQRAKLPTEVDDADFNAIRLATALGVTVVEAAGNRGVSLDAYQDPLLGRVLDPKAAGYRNSGAILVGAAHAALPHDRAKFSNFGARIDTYAWGDNVTSTGFGNLFGKETAGFIDDYTNTFNGTSSASPIIAGGAALLQALSWQNTQQYLLPAQVRALLADPSTGTPQGPNVAGAIGVMPNLKKILAETACLAPDLYFCNRPYDDGSRPGYEILTSSPDIVLDSPPRNDPMRLYGNVKGWAYLPAIGVLPGAGTYGVHVRLRNRGVSNLSKVRARLFAGPAATLIHPERWTEVGTQEISMVPQGDTVVVSPPFVWQPVDSGPYSFLAVADTELSAPPPPLPPAGPYFSWRAYLSFLRQKTVACRNVHVIPKGWVSPGTLAFEVAGTPDRARSFDLEILQQLPADLKVDLEVPSCLGAKLRQRLPWLEGIPASVSSKATVRFRLPPGRCLRFPAVSLPKGACYPAVFYLSKGGLAPGHSLAIRQLFRGTEVGRVSWSFIE